MVKWCRAAPTGPGPNLPMQELAISVEEIQEETEDNKKTEDNTQQEIIEK